jgi:hypothetical protein
MKVLILLAAFLMGCAIALGENSRVHVYIEAKPAVDVDIPTAPDAAEPKRDPVKKEKDK